MSKIFNIIICGVVIGLLVFFLVWPEMQDLESLKSELSRKKLELQYKGEYFSHLRNLSNELEQYQEDLAKIDSALPAAPSLPSLFDFFQKTTSENGLVLRSINFSLPSSQTREEITAFTGEEESISQQSLTEVQEIRFSLGLSGSYSAFKNFLFALERSARFWEVESFSLSPKVIGGKERGEEEEGTLGQGEKDKESIFSFDLQLKTHTY